MSISQKCQYAVRSVFELAKRINQGPVAIGDIAAKQAIPPRFLEVILNELKQGGFVESRRGAQGGYRLSGSPKELSVGQIIRFVDGPFDPVRCISDSDVPPCSLKQQCALANLWRRAKQALEGVYDTTTFHELVQQEEAMERSGVTDFCI